MVDLSLGIVPTFWGGGWGGEGGGGGRGAFMLIQGLLICDCRDIGRGWQGKGKRGYAVCTLIPAQINTFKGIYQFKEIITVKVKASLTVKYQHNLGILIKY